MKIVEYMKNIFNPSPKLPRDFVRNADFDTVLLVGSFEFMPEVVRAKNGLTYVYFDSVQPELIDMVRKMGFCPHLHKSRKYVPAKYIYRARVSKDMPKAALNVVNKLMTLDDKDIHSCITNPEYAKYISAYSSKTK